MDIRQHSVIYNVTDEIEGDDRAARSDLHECGFGVAAVRSIFKVPKFGTIAGCMVTEGR